MPYPDKRYASNKHRRIRESSRFMTPRELSNRSPPGSSAWKAVSLGHLLWWCPEPVALLDFSLPRVFPGRVQRRTVVLRIIPVFSPAPLPYESGPGIHFNDILSTPLAFSLSRAPTLSRFLPLAHPPLRYYATLGYLFPSRSCSRYRER